jgi:hypothetical protein
VSWIDGRLAMVPRDPANNRPAHLRHVLLEPLGNVYGVSNKVLAMALSELLLAGDAKRPAWIEAGAVWSKIEVGTQVLAEEPELYGPGWWEGVVVGVNGDDLTVRWMDEPDEDPVKVERRHVALRHPGVV